jgi:hypothetical protein
MGAQELKRTELCCDPMEGCQVTSCTCRMPAIRLRGGVRRGEDRNLARCVGTRSILQPRNVFVLGGFWRAETS